MSAFNIGCREINLGQWLRLLPRTEYDLKAKGLARTTEPPHAPPDITARIIALQLPKAPSDE